MQTEAKWPSIWIIGEACGVCIPFMSTLRSKVNDVYSQMGNALVHSGDFSKISDNPSCSQDKLDSLPHVLATSNGSISPAGPVITW